MHGYDLVKLQRFALRDGVGNYIRLHPQHGASLIIQETDLYCVLCPGLLRPGNHPKDQFHLRMSDRK